MFVTSFFTDLGYLSAVSALFPLTWYMRLCNNSLGSVNRVYESLLFLTFPRNNTNIFDQGLAWKMPAISNSDHGPLPAVLFLLQSQEAFGHSKKVSNLAKMLPGRLLS